LHGAAGLNRIFVIRGSQDFFGIHWKGHLFSARKLTGVSHWSDQGKAEAMRMIRAAQSIH
jgi:hypothetical protein